MDGEREIELRNALDATEVYRRYEPLKYTHFPSRSTMNPSLCGLMEYRVINDKNSLGYLRRRGKQ